MNTQTKVQTTTQFDASAVLAEADLQEARVNPAYSVRRLALKAKLTASFKAFVVSDRAIADDAERRAGAATGTVEARKHQLPSTLLKEIQSVQGKARIWWAQGNRSVPWDDGGWRAFSAPMLNELREEFETRFRVPHDALVEQFLEAYPRLVSEAQFRLNDLFDASAYPDVSTLPKSYSLTFEVRPIDSPSSDFRMVEGFSEAQLQVEIARAKRFEAERVQTAQATALADLIRKISHLSLSLSNYANRLENPDPTAKRGPVFESSWARDIAQLGTMVDSMNITRDPELARLAQDLRETFAQTTAEQYKTSPRIIEAASSILDETVSSLGGLQSKIIFASSEDE